MFGSILEKIDFQPKGKESLCHGHIGPLEVLKRVNNNTYKIDLSGDYNISATFNVSDLSPYVDDVYQADLRANLLQQGEDDGGPSQKFSINQVHNQLQVKVHNQLQVEVQNQVHILRANSLRLEAVQVPSFVH